MLKLFIYLGLFVYCYFIWFEDVLLCKWIIYMDEIVVIVYVSFFYKLDIDIWILYECVYVLINKWINKFNLFFNMF